MKTKHLIIPALLSALLASAPGFAQDRDHGGDRDHNQGWSQNQGGDRNQGWNRDDHGGDRNQGWNRDDHGGDRNQDRSRGERSGERHDGDQARGGGRYGDEGHGGGHHWEGAGPNHNWHRGDRLPSSYRSKRYVVNDWRSRHLRPPPRGYHWVQSNGDYVLAAIATGVIADMIINSH